MPPSCTGRWRAWLSKLGSLARDFMVGTAYNWLSTMHTARNQGVLERIFILTVACEFMGLPLLPAPYGLCLLPYLTPQILNWRRAEHLWNAELETIIRQIPH